MGQKDLLLHIFFVCLRHLVLARNLSGVNEKGRVWDSPTVPATVSSEKDQPYLPLCKREGAASGTSQETCQIKLGSLTSGIESWPCSGYESIMLDVWPIRMCRFMVMVTVGTGTFTWKKYYRLSFPYAHWSKRHFPLGTCLYARLGTRSWGRTGQRNRSLFAPSSARTFR